MQYAICKMQHSEVQVAMCSTHSRRWELQGLRWKVQVARSRECKLERWYMKDALRKMQFAQKAVGGQIQDHQLMIAVLCKSRGRNSDVLSCQAQLLLLVLQSTTIDLSLLHCAKKSAK